MSVAADSVEAVIAATSGSVDSEVIDTLVEKYDAKTLATALLGAVANVSEMDAEFTLSRERPLPRKRSGFGGGSRNGGGYRGGRRDGGSRNGGGYRGRREGGRDGERGQRERRSFDRGARTGSGDRSQRGRSGAPRRQSRDFVIKNND